MYDKREGGDRMGYSVKWVNENLGITRDMLRYYEKENLLSKEETRNPVNKYREYNDEEIEKIWGIKLLIGIGFKAKEIFKLMNDPEFDFYTAITKKVEELERKHDEDMLLLELAKSIKMTGCIPNTHEIGSIRFDDFLKYIKENWNFYKDPYLRPVMELSRTIVAKKPDEMNKDEVNSIKKWFENLGVEEITQLCTQNSYLQIIADMKEFGYDSETVQKVVSLLNKHVIEYNKKRENKNAISSPKYMKNMAASFWDSDIATIYEQKFGKEGCIFIARALAYYDGYELEDL